MYSCTRLYAFLSHAPAYKLKRNQINMTLQRCLVLQSFKQKKHTQNSFMNHMEIIHQTRSKTCTACGPPVRLRAATNKQEVMTPMKKRICSYSCATFFSYFFSDWPQRNIPFNRTIHFSVCHEKVQLNPALAKLPVPVSSHSPTAAAKMHHLYFSTSCVSSVRLRGGFFG